MTRAARDGQEGMPMSAIERYDALPDWGKWILGPVGVVVGGMVSSYFPLLFMLLASAYIPDSVEGPVAKMLIWSVDCLVQYYLCIQLLPRPFVGAAFIGSVGMLGLVMNAGGAYLFIMEKNWEALADVASTTAVAMLSVYVFWKLWKGGYLARPSEAVSD